MRLILPMIVGAALAADIAQAQEIVVVQRSCSGLPNKPCVVKCDTGETLLSATVSVTKHGITATDVMAPTSNTGIAFRTPQVAYDDYKFRLLCQTR